MRPTMFKVLLSGAVCTATLVTMSAASASSSPKTNPAPCASAWVTNSSSPINLTYWESMTSTNETDMQALVKAFNTMEHGHIVVTDNNQAGGYDEATNSTLSEYSASLSNHTSPNVVMFDQNDAMLVRASESTLPVSTCIANNHDSTSKFSTKMLQSYTFDHSLLGMPYSASIPVMYYNKQPFAHAKITKVPTTLAAVIADQTKLKDVATHKESYGVSIQYDPWEITIWAGLDNDLIVNNGNGHTSLATTATFGSDTDLVTYLTDLQKIAKAANGSNAYAPSSSQNLYDIAENHSAITFDTTAALGPIVSLLHDFSNVTLGVAALPTLTGSVKGGVPAGGNGLFINTTNSSPAQQAASWEFIEYLTSAAELATWDADSGYLPIRTDEVTAWKVDLGKEATANHQPNLPSWFEVGYKALTTGSATPASEGAMTCAYDSMGVSMGDNLVAMLTTPFSVTPREALSNSASATTADIASCN